MTQNFIDLLRLFGAAALGFNPPHITAPDAVRTLAVSHGIWYTVYPCLSAYFPAEGRDVIVNAGKSIRKNEYLINLADELKKQGTDICFLKGIAVAGLYKQPELRVSGDIDILIQKNQQENVSAFLKSKGFDVESLKPQMHHFDAVSDVAGLIEVHISLVKKKINDVLFRGKIGVTEEFSESVYNGRKILTLGVNDSINFMTAHFIKHFLLGGVGLKHVMDMLIFMQAHFDEIDREKYADFWSDLGYIGLIRKVWAIGNTYWHMNFPDADSDCLDILLTDIENSGAFGNETVRKNFLDVFISQKYAGDKDVMKDLNRLERANLFNKLFPDKKYMLQKGYSGAGKHGLPFLAAYIKRLFDLLLQLVRGKRGLSELTEYKLTGADNELTKKRLENLKKLGIL